MAMRWRALAPMTILALAASSCAAEMVQTQPPPPPPACSVSTAPLPSSDATVTVDVSRHFQTIDGFGITQRLFDDPHLTNTFDQVTQRGAIIIPADQQAAILRALFTDIGLSRLRYATDPFIEPVNDNADPAVTDLSKFNFTWKGGDGHIALVNAARPFGLTKWWGSPIGAGEAWMGPTDVAEYVEWALAIIRHWNAAGTPLAYWSIFNEPGYFQGSTTRSGQFIRDAIKAIGPVLVTEGISTRIVIPDDITPAEALSRATVILADPAARQYVAAIATHVYNGPNQQPNTASLAQLSALAAQYSLPLWMTEWYSADWFTWANSMHTLLSDYNVSAIDYLWGFFGEWQGLGPQLITIQGTGSLYGGFFRTKMFWAMGQYSAYVRPGTVRVAADAPSTALRVSAYFDGAKVVVVALNVGNSPQAVRVELGAGIPCVRSLTATRTSAVESGALLTPVTLDAPHFVTTLPGMSITTLIAQ